MPMSKGAGTTNHQDEAAAEAHKGTGSANPTGTNAPAAENVEQKQVEQDNQTQD